MMELLLAYTVVSLLIIFFLIVIIPLVVKKPDKKVPPGSKGWPILGEIMEFGVSGPEKFVKKRMEKYSAQLFQTSLLGEKVAVFCGAQGNKFVFANEGKLVATWIPKSVQKAALYPEFVGRSFSETVALMHSLHSDIFAPEAVRRYIPIMDDVSARHMDCDWNTGGNSVVRLLPLIRKYTFEVACRSFLSITDPRHIAKLFDPFSLVTAGMISMPVDFPGTAYNRALRGGKLLRDELMQIIRERRKELIIEKKDGDVLWKMLLATDENGGFFSEREIVNNIVALLMASFEGTSSTIAGVTNNLAHLPHVYNEVLKEQMEIVRSKGPNEALTWVDIEKMKYSWNTVRETLRLKPAGAGMFKEVTTEFTYAGFTIPKGWKAFWTGFSSHQNPDYFLEPDKFDPSRFAGTGPAPYTFVPFGGGRGICPGREVGRTEVLVFLHNLVTRFKLEKTIPNEKIVYYASPTLVHGLPLRLHPRQK